jgi:hypothetical protein
MHPGTAAIAARVAEQQPNHDAYVEHVVQNGEFSNPKLGEPIEIRNRAEFEQHVVNILEDRQTLCFTASARQETWRQADIYYHPPTNTAVVVPAGLQQPATAFRPKDEGQWFEDKLNEARERQPNITVEPRQGGIAALYPAGVTKNQEQGDPTKMLGELIELGGEIMKAAGEYTGGVLQEVQSIANDFVAANPNSGATQEQLENAAYFAKAVDNPEQFPPRNDQEKSQVEDRQASEEIAKSIRETNGSPGLSPQEQQAQVQDRMQEYLDRQKQMSM